MQLFEMLQRSYSIGTFSNICQGSDGQNLSNIPSIFHKTSSTGAEIPCEKSTRLQSQSNYECVSWNVHESKCTLCYSLCLKPITTQCYSCVYSSCMLCQQANTIFAFQGLNTSVLPAVRVESNKISRTARGQRGVFWELNNARREEKVDIAVCLAGQDP